MLFKEITTLYCENNIKQINALYRKNAELFLILMQVVNIVTTTVV
jgi:hypothetical protein